MGYVPAEQRRQDFIEAAVRVIAEQGMRGATTRRVAAEADAPLATLHYCFHTKEDLFLAVFQHIGEELSGEEVRQSGVGLRAAAIDLMSTTMRWSVDHGAYALAQDDLYLWAIREGRAGSRLAIDIYDVFIDRFCRILHASLGPDDDPRLVPQLARMMLSVLDGMTMQWNGHQDALRLDEDLTMAMAMIEALLTVTPRVPV